MLNSARIYVAGHKGLVGSALCRELQKRNFQIIARNKSECDLRNPDHVQNLFKAEKPEIVLLAAAKVGGIKANRDYPADFLYDNLAIAQNVIHAAFKHKVRKLVFLGSSCIYPKDSVQPIKEDALLTRPLEPTNEAYAIAKIAGIKLCQAYRNQHGCDFISVMPCNLYGQGDRWDDENAHVIPSLISKFHKAKMAGKKSMTVWGSGNPLREFLHADDAARAILCCLEKYSDGVPINIGSGKEISIHDLALLIKKITSYDGEIVFDTTMPDGVMRKVLKNDRIKELGWAPAIDLESGLVQTYEDYLKAHGT